MEEVIFLSKCRFKLIIFWEKVLRNFSIRKYIKLNGMCNQFNFDCFKI